MQGGWGCSVEESDPQMKKVATGQEKSWQGSRTRLSDRSTPNSQTDCSTPDSPHYTKIEIHNIPDVEAGAGKGVGRLGKAAHRMQRTNATHMSVLSISQTASWHCWQLWQRSHVQPALCPPPASLAPPPPRWCCTGGHPSCCWGDWWVALPRPAPQSSRASLRRRSRDSGGGTDRPVRLHPGRSRSRSRAQHLEVQEAIEVEGATEVEGETEGKPAELVPVEGAHPSVRHCQ
jgi:hypothetical protein